jgi:hypothetical protein
MAAGLRFMDDDGVAVSLDADESASLLGIASGFDAATVSACPGCRSRVLAAVAFIDVLEQAAPHARTRELVELADDAPTLHLFVVDDEGSCRHPRWRDPLHDEWLDVVEASGPHARR